MMITVPEAARRVGLNPETIRRWIRAGRLRSEKAGTQHLIDIDQLDALVDDRPVELPVGWGTADWGEMPPWEQLVRDSRAAH
jgi:excisionase family DNA binding protein